MRHRLLAAFLMCTITLVHGQAPDGQPAVRLNKRTESLLQQKILPGYRLSNRLQLLEGLSSATARLKPDQLQAFEERLRMLGLPNSAKLMVDAYMSLLTQGRNDDLPKPKTPEIVVMVPELENSIKEVLVAVNDSVTTIDPLPNLDRMEDYEGLFWEIHVLENKIVNAANFARYGAYLIEQADKQKSRGFEDQLKQLSTNFEEHVEDLKIASRDLQERKLEFRVGRMELAKKVLGDNASFMERIRAAFAGQLDAAMFGRMFAAVDAVANAAGADEEPQGLPEFKRPRLQDDQLRQHVVDLAEEIDALSGDLKHKSQLFFVGTHWWLRGRYGRGTDNGGLLKSTRSVVDPQFQFPLFIPEAMGEPGHKLVRNPEWGKSVDGVVAEVPAFLRVKNESGLKPEVPRRHHFAWMFEYRQVGPGKTTDYESELIENRLLSRTVKTIKTNRFY